jgi:hypothetical protein
MNHVIVVAVSAKYPPATYSLAHEEQTEAPQWAHSATVARPHRLSVFLEPYSIVQSDVIPVWIPVLKTQFPVRSVLKGDKAKSTAFLVAQIFPFPFQKYPLAIRVDAQNCRK